MLILFCSLLFCQQIAMHQFFQHKINELLTSFPKKKQTNLIKNIHYEDNTDKENIFLLQKNESNFLK